MVPDELLMVSGVSPALLNPIILNVNRIQQVHIHWYKVQFSLCLSYIFLIDEKYLIL